MLDNLRAQTIREHLEAVNLLFTDRGYQPPVDFTTKRKGPALFYNNVKTWETEPNRRTHMGPEFLREFKNRAASDPSGLTFYPAMYDWILLGRYAGLRLSEYGQSTQKRIDTLKPPRRKPIVKAFQRRDFTFFDKSGNRIPDPVQNKSSVHRITIKWRVQKNRRNGQKISWTIDDASPEFCPVMAAVRIYERSITLGLSDAQPMGAYRNRKKVAYITGNAIRDKFRLVAKAAYPDITDAELSQYSSHMIRVTAAVLLQCASKPGHFIQKRLRWEGDSYKTYLRDDTTLAISHIKAVAPSNEHVLALSISLGNLEIDPAFDYPVPPQQSAEEMGSYVDIN